MRRFFILLAAAAVPVLMSAQAQINTKKTKIEDFAEKTTKVVLTGNMFFDSFIEEEVQQRWTISPYEFCTVDEFEKLKTNDKYYFLLMVKGQFRKENEPGIEFLSLVKGGPDAEKGIKEMLDVVTFPLMSAESPSGRETVFLPAILDIMQEHVLSSQENDFVGYGPLNNYCSNIMKSKHMDIIFTEEDLSSEISPVVRRLYFDDKTFIVEESEADSYMTDHKENTLVSYTIAPTGEKAGAFCYKILIDAGSHELYYFRKHRINKKNGKGFLFEDIKRISMARK